MKFLAFIVSAIFVLAPSPVFAGTWHHPPKVHHHGKHAGCKHIVMLSPRGVPEGKVWMCPPVRGIR